MSTVKIKTESATTAEPTTATVDVQVKLEPSLSTADIKLEQHTSDIDTKVESGSEDDIKSEDDDDDDETNQHQRQFICEYPGCTRRFNHIGNMKRHQNDHLLLAECIMYGKAYTLTRQSLNDRWPCPIADCNVAYKAVSTVYTHIRTNHGNTMRQHQQPRQAPVKQNTRNDIHFINVDNFYVNSVRCGYHNTIGVFMCYECRLVPECLLTHLHQKHGFDEKSIDNSALPESAVNADADPSINQHTGNSHLAAAISQPFNQHHRNIAQSWLCVTSDCGYCGHTTQNKSHHKRKVHQNEQLTTVPALVLRLMYSKSNSCYFLISRLNQASGAVTTSRSRVNQHKLDHSHSELNPQDESDDDICQNETTESSNQKQQYICDYDNCNRSFSASTQLSTHRREHKLEVVVNIQGTTYTLARQSSDDRWPCPIPDCGKKYKTVDVTYAHVLYVHSTSMKQKRANIEDNNDNDKQQAVIKRPKPTVQYLNVDDFYVCGTRCGYHTPTGMFICYTCRLVPECFLTHLQQKHGYDEKSIDCAILPESARNSGSDLTINQHISNTNLAAAIREPSQCQNSDIIQGWLCLAPDCGYCCSTKTSRNSHQNRGHRGEQQWAVPALVLRLIYSKANASCLLIIQMDIATNISSGKSNNSMSQQNSERDDEDDGDELVLSDYSDDDDIN